MRFFTLLLDPDGRGIPDQVRRSYEAMPSRRGLEFAWQSFENAAVLTAWDDPYGDPLVIKHGDHLAVGMVRLDNRADLERWAECTGEDLTDLDLVLRVVALHGPKYIPQILGDFAFVIWNGATQTAVAACDAFAVKRLYYAERRGLSTFASRAEALALEEEYDLHYLTELLVRHVAPQNRTVYANVWPVPAASMGILNNGALALSRYWNPCDFDVEHAWAKSEQEAIETCRTLLVDSVRLRLGAESETWAQLSGGLDSSSVVSLVQWLAERGDISSGLAGTVTVVDRQGEIADERHYSNAVVRRWGIRNETIIDAPTWHEEGHLPPNLDQPRFDLIFCPRDRRLCSVVRSAGGRVLLTGWGGDELFMGSMLFFADWIIQGRVWQAAREMARRAAVGRASFWELAYRNALLPLVPQNVQVRLVHNRHDSPTQPWVRAATMRRYALEWQSPSVPEYRGQLGQKYRHAVTTKIASLSTVTAHGLTADLLDVRHPLTYRPLVEFGLRLPPDLRARPHAHRWVFREALRSILPEEVRTRVGKPDTGSVLAWSLVAEQPRLARLLHDPMLGELGLVDGAKLREEFYAASHQTGVGVCMHHSLLSTLAVEAWLRIRSGRWPRGGHTEAKEHLQLRNHQPSM